MRFRDAESVLVTGASGFIGQHLVRRLIERGDRVALLLLAAEKGERLHPDGVPGQGVYFVAAEHDPKYAELGQAMATASGKKRATVWCTCRDRSCHWSGFAATRWGACGNVPVG